MTMSMAKAVIPAENTDVGIMAVTNLTTHSESAFFSIPL